MLVTLDIATMPDNFGFEAPPCFTCPPAEGFVLAPSDSCETTAAFRPTESFAGEPEKAAVRVVASDPSTGARPRLKDVTGQIEPSPSQRTQH